MKRILFTLSLFVVFNNFSIGQTRILNLFSKTNTNTVNSTELKSSINKISSAQVLTLDKSINNQIYLLKDNFELTVPTKNGDLIIDLSPATIISPDFKVMTPSGEYKMDLPSFFRGKIKGEKKSFVAITVTKNSIEGLIQNDKINLTLGKLKSDLEEFHIIYNTNEITNENPICAGEVPVIEQEKLPAGFENNISATTCRALEVYLEADYQMFVDWGKNVQNVVNPMTAIFNNVAALFDNSGVNLVISKIYVWTIPDPYLSATSAGGALSLVDSYWDDKGNTFDGDLVHFVTTKGLGGGVAYLSGGTSVFNGMTQRSVFASCGKGAAKGVSSGISNFVQNIPSYSWSVNEIAHEIGHNFGLPHTHSCTWSDGITTGAIDNCYGVEGSCSPGPDPGIAGGTIMSYCHITSTGVNFANGFGLLPGGKLLAEFNAATCLKGSKIPSPIVEFKAICSPAIVTLNATGCDGGTYNWYATEIGGTALPSTNGQFTTPSVVNGNVSYYVSCTLNSCTSRRAKATIDLFSNILPPTSISYNLCGTNAAEVLSVQGCNGTIPTWYNSSIGGSSIGTGYLFSASNINTTTTYYVACYLAGCGETSRTPVVVNHVPACQYCTPSGMNCSSYPIRITRVKIALGTNILLDNVTSCSENGFELFTPANSVLLSKGTIYSITIENPGPGYLPGASIWIDQDKDGIFTSTELVYQKNSGYWSQNVGNFNVPTTSLSGQTRMRVKLTYSSIPTIPCSTDEGSGFGEIEDYIVNISGCEITANFPLVNQSPGTYKVSETIQSQANVANGTIYQAGKNILLSPGFQAGSNEVFTAKIEGCQ